MKLNFNPIEDLVECARKSEARPNALAPVLESMFSLRNPNPFAAHEHVMEIGSSGFQFMSSFDQFQEELPAAFQKSDISHFAFRNSLSVMINSKYMTDLQVAVLEEGCAREMQVFLALYLKGAWQVGDSVALTLTRKPVAQMVVAGEHCVAFGVAAILPCSKEEWYKLLEARRLEMQWAEGFWKNKEAIADLATQAVLDKARNFH